MEPTELEALRKLPPDEVTYRTYEMLHDLKIGPRLRRLEKFQYGLAVVGSTVVAVFSGIAWVFKLGLASIARH